jgi:hypothetical protein
MKPKTVTISEMRWAVLVGIISGCVATYSIFVKQPNSVCELELPRNEYCEMVSIPVEKISDVRK